VVRQNISEDISRERQSVVRVAFAAWVLATLAFSLNLLIMLVLLVTKSDTKSVTSFFLALAIAIIGEPVSWLTWYKGAYNSQVSLLVGAGSVCRELLDTNACQPEGLEALASTPLLASLAHAPTSAVGV